MLVAESSKARRLVGRLDRGADLLNQIAEVCRAHKVRRGELRAVGALEDALLGHVDQAANAMKSPRHFSSPFEILTLAGTIDEKNGAVEVTAWVSLSRERDNGVELVGGRLVAGRVFQCEFVIDAFDDLQLEAGAAPSWPQVIAASRPAPPPEPEPEPEVATVPVQAGDFIDHPQFGRMTVERVDGEQEFVSARLRNQRLIRLSLEVLTLIPAGQENGKNLFRAVSGR